MQVSNETAQMNLPVLVWCTMQTELTPEGGLSELVAVLNGRAYSKNELLDAGTPVLRVGNLFTSDKWYYSDLSLDDDKYCDNGDLIFAWSASFGPFIWNGRKGDLPLPHLETST